jgi:glycosyltransferase XagB
LGGCGGISLFEGQEAAYAVRHAAAEHFSSADRDDVFKRRLAEARAFGEACDGLAAQAPELSAKSGLTVGQRATGCALVGMLAAFVLLWPQALNEVVVVTFAGVFSLIILLRLCATIAARFARKVEPVPRTPDDQLEILTILVPLYREAADVVAALVAALTRLDYPSDKLDVKLLLEADDEDTVLAVWKANVPSHFELIPVPAGAPRTKPKALNYGLSFARGKIVAVFDAEDRPSPEQPREAVAAFRSGPGNLSVVQAPLLIHNGAEGWFPRQFEIEYAIHFRVWLPFLARLHLPLPLGGTSNYFHRDRLEAAGGWDAWNVTEDADLGLRLARFGGRTAMISSPTWEEAPPRFSVWLAQRTRWMKGHLQTWLVLMRQPFKAAKDMGWRSFASVQLTLGGSLLASTMHAPIVLWTVLGLFTPWVSLEGWHAALFGVGYGGVIAAALASRPKPPSIGTLIGLAFYWPLLSLAMIRALWEIGSRPHFWAKTPHGLNARRKIAAR